MNKATFTIFNSDDIGVVAGLVVNRVGNKDIVRERYYTNNATDQTLPADFEAFVEEETGIAAARIIKLEGDYVVLGPCVGDGIIGVAVVRPENPPVYSERR